MTVKLGVNLRSQASDWPSFLAAGRRAEELGFDSLWTWDHLYAIFGDPHQPILEGYAGLAALAQATDRIRLGLFVGANTFRNPGLVTKAVTTIDHISGGRATLGIGGAWFELEHRAFGIDFGSGFGQRLDWLGEAVPAIRALLDGSVVTSPRDGRYAFDKLRIDPAPVQSHLPIMIGGAGERKDAADRGPVCGRVECLRHAGDRRGEGRRPPGALYGRGTRPSVDRTDARVQGDDPFVRGRGGTGASHTAGAQSDAAGAGPRGRLVLDGHARTDRRDDDVLRPRGFETFIAELPAPYDAETMESLTNVVQPMVDAAMA